MIPVAFLSAGQDGPMTARDLSALPGVLKEAFKRTVFDHALGVMASSCSRALRHHACKSSRILRIHLQNSWPNR